MSAALIETAFVVASLAMLAWVLVMVSTVLAHFIDQVF